MTRTAVAAPAPPPRGLLVLELEAEVRRYRQAFLDIATEAGEDTSGIEHPDQLAYPGIDQYAVDAVRSLRERYDECLHEGDR